MQSSMRPRSHSASCCSPCTRSTAISTQLVAGKHAAATRSALRVKHTPLAYIAKLCQSCRALLCWGIAQCSGYVRYLWHGIQVQLVV